MRHPSIVGGLVSWWVVFTTPAVATAEQTPATPQRLVRQLGSLRFLEREAATQSLLQMGTRAHAAVKAGLAHPDAEIRFRCQQLLPMLQAMELHRQIDTYLRGSPQADHTRLPGLTRFVEVVGEDRVSRQFYAEMLRQNSQWLTEAEQDSKAATQEYAHRLEVIYGLLRQSSLRETAPLDPMSIAVILFVGAHPKVASQGQLNALHLHYFLLQSPLQTLLKQSSEEGKRLRKLFVAWGQAQQSSNASQLFYKIAARLQVREALPLALRALTNPAVSASGRVHAMLLVGKLGNTNHRPVLRPFLTDHTVVGHVSRNNLLGKIQVRDVALAITVHLSGKPLKSQDFPFLRPADPLAASYSFAFSNETERETTFKKYQGLLHKQP